MSDAPETLAALLARYRPDHDEPSDVPRVSLADAMRAGDDPLHVIPHLAGLGLPVRSLDDLMRVNDDASEAAIGCFRVADCVAVASDGLWLLFVP